VEKDPGLSGTHLDGYVVGELIGHGGMGAIYKGRQTRLGREVAIKFLLKLPGFTPMLSDRFRKETKIHMQLSHPNLVKLLDAGIYLGFPYIVMELIEGVSLQSSLGSGPLSPMSTLLAVADLIAQGLDYLAGQGVQHRDIKPANVILGPGKIVKICDFGLAHMDGRTPLTTPGSLLGSLPYMAPEFIRGEAHDLSSDAYSFGVLLYRMATGSLPYVGRDVPHWVELIAEQVPPSVSEARSDATPEFADLVARLLEKKPENRATINQASETLSYLVDKGRVSRSQRASAFQNSGPRVSTRDSILVAGLSLVLALFAVIAFLTMYRS